MRRWFVLKALFACPYAIVFAEVFLRALWPVPVVPRYVTAGTFGIRVNEPDRQYWHTSADFKIQIRTNSRGIRADEEIPYEKAPGLQRIVVLGDSFAMGYEVNLEDTFLTRMEKQLRAAGLNVQVVNLAVSGHGNAEELLMLQHEGLKYQPDLVLLCWHRSDLTDNVRSGLFELKDGQLKPKNPAYLPGVQIQHKLYRIPGYDWVQAHSNLYAFLREWISWNVAKPILLALQSKSAAAAGAADPDAAAAPDDAYPGRLTIALLNEIQRVSSEAGAKFLVMDIPDQSDNVEFRSILPADGQGGHYGLPVVSLLEPLRARAGQPLYWLRSQGHFTPLGCRIAGDCLAQHILDHHLLGQGGEPRRPADSTSTTHP
jgi:hypothetical protein